MVESKKLLVELREWLAKVANHTLTSKLLAAWTEEQYWLLMEGEGSSDETPAAEFLREILAEVTAQWECLLGNLYDESGMEGVTAAEFPQQAIAYWLAQVGQFLETLERGDLLPLFQ